MPSGRGVLAPGAAGVWAEEAAAHRQTAHVRRKPLNALRYTVFRAEVRAGYHANSRPARTAPARKIDPATQTVRLVSNALFTAVKPSEQARRALPGASELACRA